VGVQNGKILLTSFGWLNGDDVITDFLKFDFVTISLKKHNLIKSRYFRSPILKINRRWGAESPQRLAIFENLLLK